jgi:hypothetical protein
MNWIMLLPVALAVRDLPVQVRTTAGEQRVGQLETLRLDSVSLRIADGSRLELDSGQVREVRFPEQPRGEAASCWLQLTDQSRVAVRRVSLSRGEIALEDAAGQRQIWSARQLRLIRWQPLEAGLPDLWNEILRAGKGTDLLVIRRSQGNLDYLPGVVQAISADTVEFLYQDQTVPVPREKVDGVVFFQPAREWPAPRAVLTMQDGSTWNLEDFQPVDSGLRVTSACGATANVPGDQLRHLRFPIRGVDFLSEIEPEVVQWTPYFGAPGLTDDLSRMFQPRRNEAADGGPLRLTDLASAEGARRYEKGLAIHSRTELVYRLAGRYRRLEALAGFDAQHRTRGNVLLVISADGQTLLERALDVNSPAVPLSIDVSQVKRLTILVDFGQDLDVGDWLHLCDARLVK